MKSEELKHKIVIQKYENAVNDNGFEEEAWVDFKTVWAAISNLYGKEYFEAAAVQAEKTVKFTIRFTKDIDESMRIMFQGKQYNITSIDNIKYANKFIEIKAMEVDSSG
ncbi:phage head closure protein [Clostridium botulinum]|uniref:phage head closure protein n=1 Tax=Clostridium botulinum TaxID=1491 RepID=UPI0007739116|nr:phage head closure protein [Clostridium botulinum]NFL36787.1 head-tail adaptor protein [Clostridium botulinum]NFL64533.1 head-tail adaptor protein [Clostridium botulinum]NFN06659.1 head-tail adaptor protein [Clostridium botulinum]NFN23523.1 head-tail adaptor protein [Clostridium botulinum]NFN30191.1 head-tail adaptor protein [Clostridium botulinum]